MRIYSTFFVKFSCADLHEIILTAIYNNFFQMYMMNNFVCYDRNSQKNRKTILAKNDEFLAYYL